MTIQQAIKQLERSERGQMTSKLLLDFLKSHHVSGLDGSSSEAVVTLVAYCLLGCGSDACAIKDGLQEVVQHNQWVLI
jgi:hypothetical protein